MNDSRLTVNLGARSYPIVVGAGLLVNAADHIVPQLSGRRTILISDSNVAPLYAHALKEQLVTHGIACELLVVPAGEASKSFSQFGTLMEQLLALKPDRITTIIALGGGVVGDLAGFAASVLLRGVPFIQIPTTLLAQVDSSVGGKTAINAALGKNLIGSFYQPRLVLADSDVMQTLPPREMRAGYAEIIKYGLIMDADFYRWCLANGDKILANDAAAIAHAVLSSCRMKGQIVAEDEHEAGARAHLNFGHTFGHALEAETGFGDQLLHGEAVAIGMVMACRLSERMGLLDASVERELAAHFKSKGMHAHVNDIPHAWDANAIARHFGDDKKAEGGQLTFVVLESLGRARVAKKVPPDMARAVVASYLQNVKV